MFNLEAHTDAIDKMDKRCDVIEERMAELKYASAIRTNNIEKTKAIKDLDTYGETIYDIAYRALERLEMLFREGFNNSDVERICHIGDALIRDARNLLDEGNDYIEKEFGRVAIIRACYGHANFTPEEMLCVDLEPSVISPLGKVDFPAERLNPGE